MRYWRFPPPVPENRARRIAPRRYAMRFSHHPLRLQGQGRRLRSLARELEALLAGEPDLIANAANTAALIFDALPDINWAGFYFLKVRRAGRRAVPGQACLRAHRAGQGRVRDGRGRARTLVVPDVHEFPGHIACDAASRSEIVVPLIAGATLLGVLDIDSPRLARFDEADAAGLERLAALFVAASPAAARSLQLG